jgi:hypothetical protein
MILEFIKEQINAGIKAKKNHFGIKNFWTGGFDIMQEAFQIIYTICIIYYS